MLYGGLIITKDENIVVRVDHATKVGLKKIADSRGLTLSDLILTLLSDGAKLERQRREQVKKLASAVLKK